MFTKIKNFVSFANPGDEAAFTKDTDLEVAESMAKERAAKLFDIMIINEGEQVDDEKMAAQLKHTMDLVTTKLGGRLPHRTYGIGLMCALYSISEGLAASPSDKCYYVRWQKTAEIFKELDTFMKDRKKFREYCDGKIREHMNLDAAAFKAYKVQAGLDRFDWAAPSNLEVTTIGFLLEWWLEKHPEDGPLDVLLLQTFHRPGEVYGVKPQIQTAVRLIEHANPNKSIVLRSIDSGNAYYGGGHFEVFLNPLDGSDHRDEESLDGLSRDPTPFLRATDPRLNGGIIPHTHVCSPAEPCTKKKHSWEFHDKGAEFFIGASNRAGKVKEEEASLSGEASMSTDGNDTQRLDNVDSFAALKNFKYDDLDEDQVNAEPVVSESGTLLEGIMITARKEVKQAPAHHEAGIKENADAKLISLAVPNKHDTFDFNAVKDWPISIAYLRTGNMPASQFLPPGKIRVPYGGAGVKPGQVKLQGSFSRFGIAPGIKLSFFMARGGKIGSSDRYEKNHSGNIIFHFNPVHDHRTNRDVTCIRPGTFKATWHNVPSTTGRDNEYYLEMTFTADFAVTQNLVPSFNFPVPEPKEAAVLSEFMRFSQEKGIQVNIRFYPFVHEVKKIEADRVGTFQLQEALRFLPGQDSPSPAIGARRNFWAYKRAGTERVGIQFKQLLQRSVIATTTTPFQLMPATERFIDKSHAELALGYGHYLEFEESKAQLLAIANHAHVCSIHSIGDNVVVGIRLYGNPDSGLGNAHFAVQPNTKLKMTIESDLSRNGGIEVMGITTEMDLDMSPPATLQALVVGREAAKLRPLAQPGLHLPNANRYAINIDPEINETVISFQLDATRKAYDPSVDTGSKGTLLPTLLYDGLVQGTQNPWAGCRDQERATQAFDALRSAENWTPTQLKVIDRTKLMTLGMSLVTGCGGAGKTLIQVHKAHAATQAGDKVLFTSDRNSVLDTICLKYVKHYPDAEPPVRAYAVQRPAASLHPSASQGPQEPEGLSQEELLVWQIVQQKHNERRTARFSLLEYSVEGHIMRHIADGTEHFVQLTHSPARGVSEPDPLMPNPVNVFVFYSNGIDRIQAARDARRLGQPAPAKTSLDTGACAVNEYGGPDAESSGDEDPDIVDSQAQGSDDEDPDIVDSQAQGSDDEDPGTEAEFPSLPGAWTATVNVQSQGAKPEVEDENDLGDATTTDPELFSDDEQRWFKQVQKQCRKYVLNNAKIVLSTTINCGNEEVRKHFAEDEGDRVWFEVDEATTISEGSMLVPLAKSYPTFGRKIVSKCFYGDPKQLGPLVFSSDGQNNQPCYNEFGNQVRLPLFDRLVKCGFPVIELPNQARMHPDLWNHANRIFYDYNIEFMGDLSNFALDSGWEDMVRKLLGYAQGDVIPESQQRLMWVELVGKNTRRSMDTGSRANLVNYLWIMELVKGQLHAIFKDQMFKKVGLLMPYQRQRQMYSVAFNELRKQGWSDDALPKLYVIDSMVGDERDYVIFDTVVSSKTRNGLGFVRDEKRMCVANTRARKAIVYVGSSLPDPKFNNDDEAKTRTSDTAAEQGEQKPRGADTAKDEVATIDDPGIRSKKKSQRVRHDQFGEEIDDFTIAEYHRIASRAGTAVHVPLPDIDEFAWPLDLWDSKYLPGFEATKQKSRVRYGAGGFVYLTTDQKALVISETERIEKEEQAFVSGTAEPAVLQEGFMADTETWKPDPQFVTAPQGDGDGWASDDGNTKDPAINEPKVNGWASNKTAGDEHPGEENAGDEHPGDEHPGDEHPGDEHPGDEHPGEENAGDADLSTSSDSQHPEVDGAGYESASEESNDSRDEPPSPYYSDTDAPAGF